MGHVERLFLDGVEVLWVTVLHSSHSEALLVAQELVAHVISVSVTTLPISEAATSAAWTETTSHVSILGEEQLCVGRVGVVSVGTASSLSSFSVVLLDQLTHSEFVEWEVFHVLVRESIQIHFGSHGFGARFPALWRTGSALDLGPTFPRGRSSRSLRADSLPGFSLCFALYVLLSHRLATSSDMLNVQIFWYLGSPHSILWHSSFIPSNWRRRPLHLSFLRCGTIVARRDHLVFLNLFALQLSSLEVEGLHLLLEQLVAPFSVTIDLVHFLKLYLHNVLWLPSAESS